MTFVTPCGAGWRRARRRSSGRRGPSTPRMRCRTCTRTSRCARRRREPAHSRNPHRRSASRAPWLTLRRLVQVEHGKERLLRHLDAPDVLHPLLALLLLLEQLALARDVAAVALREHVLAPRLDRLARDHARADGGLDRHVEHLAGDL